MTQSTHTVDELQTWLVSHLAQQLARAPSAIDPSERFSHYGLDSAGALALMAALSAELGRALPPTLVWTYPTPEALAGYLAGRADAAVEGAQTAPGAADPVAIIGLACRLPGAPNPAAFWRLLCAGTDAIREVPRDRWDLVEQYDPDPAAPGKMHTRWGGFLDEVDRFDPLFFGISPREAAQMDPQQRLMLELTWEALADAGLPAERLRGHPAGVFFGAMWSDYARLANSQGADIVQHTATGQDTSIISARVSYVFGLEGPSLTINTACSSSLAAVHLACQSLRSGESTIALAGGVSLMLSPESTVTMCKFGAMAPDGRSRAFDARADGYVRGEGGGIVVLKPLSRALAAGDPIYAVIRGSALNNDGFSNGLTAPNPKAQEAVLRLACSHAGVRPDDMDYIEAHGTGTPLGDPIEAGAIGAVFGASRSADRPLLLGSVKTNIGHLEAAAGVAGLIKVALSLRHGQIPPSLHFENPNTQIPFEAWRLKVPTALRAWPISGHPRLAGVSSFGFGGTNCHVVVEGPAPRAELVPVAGANPEDVQARAAALAAAPGGTTLEALAGMAGRWLSAGTERMAVMCRSLDELRDQLAAVTRGENPAGLSRGQAPGDGAPRVVFVLPGQGAQQFGMARRLLAQAPVFQAALERFDQVLQRLAGWSVLSELTAPQPGPRTTDVDVVQGMLCGIQIALADQWRAWGIEPAAVIGHSLGEIAAAYIAGALSLEEAARVEWLRGEALQRLRGSGGMLLAALSEDEGQAMLSHDERQVVLGVSNGPRTIVFSGATAAVQALAARLAEQGIFHRRLPIDIPSHSPLIDPAAQELEARLGALRARGAAVPIYSTVTGARVAGTVFNAAYWAQNLRQPVRFAAATRQAIEDGYSVFLELSPHPTLTRPIRESLAAAGREGVVLGSLQHDEDDRASLLTSLGQLYVLGAPVDWQRVHSAPGGDAPPAWAAVADETRPAANTERAEVLVLSARTPDALRLLAEAVVEQLAGAAAPKSEDLAYSASRRRSHLEHRLAVVAGGSDQLQARLKSALAGARVRGILEGRKLIGPRPQVAFVFCGQGAQWAGMGRALLAEPAAREALAQCELALGQYADWSLLDELTAPAGASRLDQTAIAQPAICALQIAAAALWRAWGIEPDAVVGHSVGEIAAAHVAGVLTLAEAMRVAFHRGRIMQRAAGQGGMAAVRLSAEAAAKLVAPWNERLSLAAINSPNATVIAGDRVALQSLGLDGSSTDVGRLLDVDYAFHSAQMTPFQPELAQALEGLAPQPPRCVIVSTVSGQPSAQEDFSPAYWSRGIREPVRFAEAMDALISQGCGVFLEVGPHPVLAGAIAECLEPRGQPGTVLATLQRVMDGRASLLETLGAFYIQGWPVDWRGVYPAGNFVRLPDYPWQRERYWFIPGAAAHARPAAAPDALPLLGKRLRLASQDIIFEGELSPETGRLLADHRVGAQALYPAAGFVEMALAAGAAWSGQAMCVEGLVVSEALALSVGAPPLLQTVLTTQAQSAEFRIFSTTARAGAAWTLHASGRLRPRADGDRFEISGPAVRQLLPWPVEDFYRAAEQAGLNYGPRFRRLAQLAAGPGAAWGELTEAPADSEAGRYQIHPATLDACFQVCLAALLKTSPSSAVPGLFLPMAVERVVISGRPTGWLRAEAVLHEAEGTPDQAMADLRLTDEAGRVVAQLQGVLFRRAAAEVASQARGSHMAVALHTLQWDAAPLPSRTADEARAHNWLVINADTMFGSQLAAQLTAGGAGCLSLSGVREVDVRSAVAELAGTRQASVGVVYLAGENLPASHEELGESSLDALRLIQTLAAIDGPRLRLWIITRGTQAVGERPGPVEPAQGPLWGLGRTMAQEHPALWGGLVDLDPNAAEADAAALANELRAAGPAAEVALRGGQRFVARLAPLPAVAAPERPLAIRADASYLVTGGCGALGLAVAAWLAQHGVRKLVLMGRSAPSAAAAQKILGLEQAGARVQVVQGDVAREADVRRVLAEAGQLGPLAGIVHAAGVLEDGVLQELTPDGFRRALAPKAVGAWHLHRQTADTPLDFFVMFSSLAAVLGSAGQANYAAANAYLDALAHARRAAGLPALSINWGPWAGMGMAAAENRRGGNLWASRGVGAIAPADALAALDVLLRMDAAQVAVMPPTESRPATPSAAARPDRLALAGAPPETRRQMLETYVLEQVAGVLTIPVGGLDPQQPLNRLGLDSLMAVELRNRVASDLGLTVPMASFLRGPSVIELAALLAGRWDVPEPPTISSAPATHYRLTRGQLALWTVYQMAPESPAYNIGWAARLTGPLDVAALRAALQALVDRHAALRSTITTEGGQPLQRVHESVRVDLPAIDSEWGGWAALRPLLDETFHQPFDLAHGPALRARLFRLSAQEHVLQLVVHHVLADFWSLLVLIDELQALYLAQAAGRPVTLTPLARSYADFAAWNAGLLATEVGKRQWAYWSRQLGGPLPVLELPTDRPRPAVQTYQGASYSFRLDSGLSRQVKALAQAEGVTLNTALLAAFQVLLHRYSGQTDLLVGTLTSGRSQPEFSDLMGYCVNPVALRANCAGDPTFRSFLSQTRQSLLEALENQDYPFAQLVERLQLGHDPSRSPLVQAMFVLQQPQRAPEAAPFMLGQAGGNSQWGELQLESVALPLRQARFDLDLMLFDQPEGLAGFLQYSTELFDAATIARLVTHFENLLRGIVADPDGRLAMLPLLDHADHDRLRGWNATEMAIGAGSVAEWVSAQARRSPQALAVSGESGQLTYGQLAAQAARLAHHLRAQGVGRGDLVAIALDRTPALLSALLGVLQAGAAYLPLDLGYPAQRLAYILGDARPRALLTQADLLAQHFAQPAPQPGQWRAAGSQLQRDPAAALVLVEDVLAGPAPAAGGPLPALGPDDLAYVIYTSGSTGQPKGVAVGHGALANALAGLGRTLGVEANDRLLAITTLAFDIAGLELWLPLTVGGQVVLASAAEAADGARLAARLAESGATILQATPTTWRLLLGSGWAGRVGLKAWCGGERLPRGLADELLGKVGELWNLYGPTETTIWSTAERVAAGTGEVAIGRPIANTQVYVLDERGQVAPVGVVGELYIGGRGLAQGYWRQAGLTAARFVADGVGGGGGRLYRTGDRGRWRGDGRLECLGRADQQVKLRGRRIELGEIEAVLGRHAAVGQAVAAIWEGGESDQRLVAYVVPETEAAAPDGGPALPSIHVSQWQSVWDETYRQTPAQVDPAFNIVGWNSSDTGRPIPPEEMHAWVDDSVERILAARPRRVLEIGCGSGLLLFPIAPHTELYLGTDYSRAALDTLAETLRRRPLSQVTLQQRAADDFAGLAPHSFDAVILNSVVQYFPGSDYLQRVLEGAVRLVRPGGLVFVGDVRSLPLLEAFHATVALQQAPAQMGRPELRAIVRQRQAQEEELALDPAFFNQLPDRVPQVAHVAIHPRRGRAHNELTRFRYQVVLSIGPLSESALLELEWRDWDREQLSLDRVRQVLATGAPLVLALSGVPNARLAAGLATLAWLEGDTGPASAGVLRETLRHEPPQGVDPAEVWSLADEFPYRVELGWGRHTAEGAFDVLLARRDQTQPARVRWPHAPAAGFALTNDPVRAAFGRQVVPELRSLLKENLPEYMLPSVITVLSALPRTPNGKIDRRALPAPEAASRSAGSAFTAPRTALEQALAGIWAGALGVEPVGIHDSFFELGGHSLLVIQVVVRIREGFEIDLPFRSLFTAPTIAGLAETMLSLDGQRTRIEQTAELLVQLARLSDGEVEALLAQESPVQAGAA